MSVVHPQLPPTHRQHTKPKLLSHVPHGIVPPQPSSTTPHVFPLHALVGMRGVHPQTFGTLPPPQVAPVPASSQVEGPQTTGPPQLSLAVPQLLPAQGLPPSGTHPHTFGTPPPPQVAGDTHVPPT
jgi:hypothetical protein